MRTKEKPSKVATQLQKVRAFCLALDSVSERLSHGSPTYFYKKRVLCYFLDNHHGDGRLALWLPAAPGIQAALVDTDPEVYFVPPYVGVSGWVGVRLDRTLAWKQIAALIEAAHAFLQTKKR